MAVGRTGRIPQPFIDEIVARSDIVEIIGARVPLKKAGREFKGCCPFHSEKSPSFYVSPDKQFYHCFGCEAHGTVIGFLIEYEKLGFIDAVADLAQRAGLELPREAQGSRDEGSADLHDLMSQAARFFEQNLADNPRGRDYLQARGIDAPTTAKFALGFAPDSWNALLNRYGGQEDDRRRLLQTGLIIERDTRGGERTAGFYDRFRDRLMFPDPRFAWPCHRLRRPRHRPGRAQILELARNAVVSQRPRIVRIGTKCASRTPISNGS